MKDEVKNVRVIIQTLEEASRELDIQMDDVESNSDAIEQLLNKVDQKCRTMDEDNWKQLSDEIYELVDDIRGYLR